MKKPVSEYRQRIVLGHTGLQVSRIGLASSYGVGGDAVEEAYQEYGINYLYWGTMRRESFGDGIRRLARRNRADLVVVVQSYARFGSWLQSSYESALRRLQIEYADICLLGMHNRRPSPRVLDAALRLRERGKARFLAVSCHRRPSFQEYIREGIFDVLMFRYNAAHRGAEKDIFPYLPEIGRPGTVSYTATRWGGLINPKKIPEGEPLPRASDCYRFVLSQPRIDLCLAGPADTEQMREALKAIDRGPMNEEELAWMRRIGDYVNPLP